MALRVWLPLNGSLENIGISNTTLVSGTPSYKAGKISAQALNLNNRITFDCANLANLKTFSVCFWGMTEASSTLTTDWQDLLGFTDVSSGGTNGTFRWETCYNYNAPGIHWHDNATNALVNGSVTHIATRDTWCHCCVVFDFERSKVYSYTNGIRTAEYAHLGGHFNANGRFYLGETNNIEGRINDVRFYDHALSAKEVKEIAQGLILHYKLNGLSGGVGENLGFAPTTATNFGSSSELRTITFSGWDAYAPLNLNLTADEWNAMVGQQITYSCWMNNIEQTAGTGTGIMLHVRYADSTYQQYGGGKNGTNGSYLAQGESGWLKLTITIPDPTTRTNPTTISHVQFSIRHNSSSGASTVQYQYAKVEKGNQQTAWSPAPSEIGIDTSVIPDSSGYGHNGTAYNAPSIITDSSRYTVCTQFNGSNQFITNDIKMKNNYPTDAITVAWWGYMNTWSSYGRAISCTEGGGWNFEPSSGKINWAMGTGASSNTYKSCTSNTTLASLTAGWHHFAGTYDGIDSKIYIDGQLDKTLNCYTEKTPIFYANTYLLIGCEATTSGTGNTTPYFNGKLNDIRIYATALSAEDILDLYHTSANIDNLHNLHTFECVELDSTNPTITHQGQTKIAAQSQNNLWTGTQYNRSNMTVTYNVPTNVFKSYGFNTAMQFTPTHAADGTQFMAYSYICNSSIQYANSQEYTFSMYAYVSNDCNANFRINLEHSNTWVANYQNTTSNINDTTKGQVIRVWGKCKAHASDGKIYIMFYFNPNQTDVFTTGYVLVTGLNVVLGNTVIPPTEYPHTGFTQDKNISSIANNIIIMNDYIEK